jgi:hypothetical protein
VGNVAPEVIALVVLDMMGFAIVSIGVEAGNTQRHFIVF